MAMGLPTTNDRAKIPTPRPITTAITRAVSKLFRISSRIFARMIPVSLTRTLDGGHALGDGLHGSDLARCLGDDEIAVVVRTWFTASPPRRVWYRSHASVSTAP
jgi:hypothetical protein